MKAYKQRKPWPQRFWDKVCKSDSCWEWGASLDHHGYGQISQISSTTNKKTMRKSHRVSYELYYSVVLSPNECVLHTCDNPKCVNPAHLYIGDRNDNHRDMVQRGRIMSGDNASWSKLNSQQVTSIRQRLTFGEPQAKIAREYGIHQSTISYLKNNKTWRY